MSTKKYRVIGKMLQEARIKKGWTIEDVQLKLQISKRYLMAIEAGEDDDLPGDYYTQSLVQQYADLLNVKVAEGSLKKEPRSIQEWRREHHKPISRTEEPHKKSVLRALNESHPWAMGGILVMVIWLLVWGAFNDTFGQTKSNLTQTSHIKVVDDTVKKKHKKAKPDKSTKEQKDDESSSSSASVSSSQQISSSSVSSSSWSASSSSSTAEIPSSNENSNS